MEKDSKNDSTFPVPATMSNVTIVSTPMPQAASTATKRHSYGNFTEVKYMDDTTGINKDELDELIWMSEKENLQKELRKGNIASMVNEFDSLGGFQSCTSTVPSEPWNKFLTEFHQKGKSPKRSIADTAIKTNYSFMNSKDTSVNTSSTSKPTRQNISSLPKGTKTTSATLSSFTSIDNLNISNVPETLGKSTSYSKFENKRDIIPHQDDRASVASSANSSLGVIPSDVLDEAHRYPLVDANQDLSLRFAQNLNLDPSLLKDGDVSALAFENFKEKLEAQRKDEENKENQRNSGRSSSDYWTIHGYSSDNSRNNTAKRLSSLSSKSDLEAKSPNKLNSSSRTSLRSLSENNYSSPFMSLSSKSGRYSVGSNPFGSYSNISVNSEDFQSGEAAMNRLERDERQFSMASTRSLSGIYGDANPSFSLDGEKLSMSSFLRSGSGPLGCLESDGNDSQRPQFGMPSRSPEKTGKPRAILPPPQDNPTFLVEEEPVRDSPWTPHSLMEQYSNIHSTATDPDVSVPSLSYISQMLENMTEKDNPRDIIAQLLDCQKIPKNKPGINDQSLMPNRISSFVEGGNRFCEGINAERSFAAKDHSSVWRTSLDGSAAASTCDVTDFEGDEEAYVCVMTPQSMDFDIFNELPQPIEYKFSKACYVDGQRKDGAAYIHFPLSKLILFPGQRKTITINIAALVGGVIKIKIEVARKNPLTQIRECSYVYGKIFAELPRVSLMTQRNVEMEPILDQEFDRKYQHTVVMKNEGRSVVPLKLILTKITNDDVMFYFSEKEKNAETTLIEPGQTIKRVVQCNTPPVFAPRKSQETLIPVEARLDFELATTDFQLHIIDPVTLVAHLKPYFFGAPSSLDVPSRCTLFNSGNHPVLFDAVCEFGYTVQPSSFTVPPHEKFVLSVATAEMKNPKKYGELTLHSSNPRAMYSIRLQENHCSSISSNSSLATPHSSRPTTPTSPSSLGIPVEELKVSCSYNQLVWGSCHLHQRIVKTFCLKNVGNHREKLRLTVLDNSSCFKIVSETDNLQSELKLSLQPMENKEIKVAVLPTAAGPLWGILCICRISRSDDKKGKTLKLPLYAFGGKGKVSLTESIFELGGNKFLFLDDKTLQSTFVLSNSGDSCAFFRIVQANVTSSWGLSVTPQQSVLPAGRSATIQVHLSVTAERIEFLLQQTAQYVCVAQLNICFGDESTRQRLLRMRGLDNALATLVTPLSDIPAHHIPHLDKLNHSTIGAEQLWYNDIGEHSVGVLIKRTALEALRLDTAVNFVDLSATISELKK